jgi:1,4-dihydroxy-2-naphthoate octaprenyltransferase
MSQHARKPISLKLSDVLTKTNTVSNGEWQRLGWPTRWLLMIRAPLLILTLSSVLLGILSAALQGFTAWDRAFALIFGLSMAHALNNLLNDWTDSTLGIDANNYFRTQYGVHVLEQSLTSKSQFLTVVLITLSFALISALYLYLQLGVGILYLTLAGGFFVLFYSWPLKHFALGELAVFLSWGPLMILGSYYAISGESDFLGKNFDILLLSLIYGLTPTLVIMAKHMDKVTEDKEKGVHTLPVIIGSKNSGYLTICIIGAKWILLGQLVLWGGTWFLLICLPCIYYLPNFISSLTQEKPLQKPKQYPKKIWPLWYSALAFQYVRSFSCLLILALVITLFWNELTDTIF